MKNKVLNDTVVIEINTKKVNESMTDGGIILVKNDQDEQQITGKIIQIGNGRVDNNGKTIPMQVEIGDEVIIQKFAGIDITVDSKKLRLVKESDILYII